MAINLSSLKSAKSTRANRRVGRGHGSGKGKTSGRGHKGYKARTGSTSRLRFEGGQMSLLQRIPKLKGFKQKIRTVCVAINVSDLKKYAKNGEILKKNLISDKVLKKGYALKVLGNGEIKSALKVETDKITLQAREKIEKAGGSVIITGEKKA